MVETTQEPQAELVQNATAVSVASNQPQAEMTTGCKEENLGIRGVPSAQGVLNFIAFKYFQSVDPSKPEELNGYLQYLKEVRKVLVLETHQGSLSIIVECSSLQILEELWKDYCTGHLNEVAQEFLATEEILKQFGLCTVKLMTTIEEEEYRACKVYLMNRTGGYDRIGLNRGDCLKYSMYR